MRAADPRNVRDALLEAGYSPEEVEEMLYAVDPARREATRRLVDAARSQLTEPLTINGYRLAGEARACQDCRKSPFEPHDHNCSIKAALDALGLHPIPNRATLTPKPTPTGVPPTGRRVPY
jgi:hypothetical protein